MDTDLVRDMISVIERERARRRTKLPRHYEAAADQWMFTDQPFLNELCVLVLLAIHHELERALVRIAARKTAGGKRMSRQQYEQSLRVERERWRRSKKKVIADLCLNSFPEWNRECEVLRQIANSYKHTPWRQPEEDLLRLLKLDLSLKYASIPESDAIREGLARYLKMRKNAQFPAITSEMLTRVNAFLASVGAQPDISDVERGFVSLLPRDMEH